MPLIFFTCSKSCFCTRIYTNYLIWELWFWEPFWGSHFFTFLSLLTPYTGGQIYFVLFTFFSFCFILYILCDRAQFLLLIRMYYHYLCRGESERLGRSDSPRWGHQGSPKPLRLVTRAVPSRPPGVRGSPGPPRARDYPLRARRQPRRVRIGGFMLPACTLSLDAILLNPIL